MKFVKTTVLEWTRNKDDGDLEIVSDGVIVAFIRKGEKFRAIGGSIQLLKESDDMSASRHDTEAAAVAWVESKLPDVFGERVE